VDDPQGRRIGAVVVFADVTDRARAVAIREAYTGILSHELRTPVTSIYGAAELLSRRGESMSRENRAILIEDLEGAAEHLLRLVENLLILSRAEHRAVQVDVAPLLVQRVAADLLRQEARTWPACTIEVVTPHGSPPPVLGDSEMVTLMLRNLIGNAAKYASGRLQIALEPDGDHLRVAVRDHGPGIPSSELASVFQLFHRSPTTATRAPGSGIGLYVVRHLAEAQGGRAWARNLPGGGAEVGFSLPVVAETGTGEL
jgi:signal transduction histidine kinase